MAKLEPNYSIIFSIEPTSPLAPLYETFCKTVAVGNTSAYYTDCQSINLEDPHYLEFVVALESTAQGLTLRVPHTSVLLISEQKGKKRGLGFVQTLQDS